MDGASRSATVTRGDVARLAGVSSAVVSYVINGGPRNVKPATADRVRRAIDVLGYRPNLSARALKRGKTELLALVIPDSTNPYFAELAHAIEESSERRGHVVVMANHGSNGAVENRLVEDLVSRGADHFLIASGWAIHHLAEARHPGPPTVLIDCPAPVPGYATIGPASESGTRAAVQHLLAAHRHSSVALVLGESGPEPENRERGWRLAHEDSGLPTGPIARGAFNYDDGYKCGQYLLGLRQRPTAVLATSDLQAFGLLRAIGERGLRVPDDVAVISFDGTIGSGFGWPPLTVVQQPIHQMAEAAVATVLHEGGPDQQHQMFAMDLIIRNSCGCSPTP
ncbi:MAG TPA: LacI family DNA-binding transcriptional regulator [Propionibacteriaceae bacterium]|nr:LacI family DNA-binding transcriptional regulator [Propionibacteriaceae bacterium]